jgi:hypothetical protein
LCHPLLGFLAWNYSRHWPETLNAVGETPAHYGTEAEIARGIGDEVIGGIESSDCEQRTAAQAKAAEGENCGCRKKSNLDEVLRTI